METVFLDAAGVILVDFLHKGAAINSDVYINTLKKLKARTWRARFVVNLLKVLLNHSCVELHTSFTTHEVISSLDWSTIAHPTYCPDLAPSDHFSEPFTKV